MNNRSRLLSRLLYVAAIAIAGVPLLTGPLAAQSDAQRQQQADKQRETSSRVPDLLKALEARPGAAIADVGAGDGFYTVRIARAVEPGGRATGVDINDKAIAAMRARVAQAGLTNVDVVTGAPDDPHLAVGAFDAVLVHNAYHEMSAHEAMLKHIYDALRSGGRLVMVEPHRESTRTLSREQQVAKHTIEADLAEPEVKSAGFDIAARDDGFVKFVDGNDSGGYWLIVAVKR